jgi:tetratricopeptide (TPR) repeat protein
MLRRPSTHVDDPAAVGQRLRQAREGAGLTQRQLAFEACTSAYVSRIEAGARVPSLQILHEFASRLGVDTEYLATGRAKGEDSASKLVEAEVVRRLGDETEATELFEQVRADGEFPAAVARAKLGLGLLALGRGDQVAGVAMLEDCLESGELTLDEASAAAQALARSYLAQGRADEAFSICDRSLDEARARGDHFNQVRFALLRASAFTELGDVGAATTALGEVLGIAAEIVEPRRRARLYWSLSRTYHAQGEVDHAQEYARLADAVLKASERARGAAHALLLLARFENDQRNAGRALELLDKGKAAAAEGQGSAGAAYFAIERARALDMLGNWEEARSLLLVAMPLLDELAPAESAPGYMATAELLRSHGESARALELYDLVNESAPNRHAADALAAMAEIYEALGETQMAVDLVKRALAAQVPLNA